MSSGDEGNLAVWDLEERRLVGQMSGLHRRHPVTGLAFILGEPILVPFRRRPLPRPIHPRTWSLELTNAGDNGIRSWIFDQPSGLARQLAERNGHAAPVNCLL